MSQTEQKREYGEATALEIMRALGLSSHDLPKLARYARKCFEDGAAEQRRKDAEGQEPVAWHYYDEEDDDDRGGWRYSSSKPSSRYEDVHPLYTHPANVAAQAVRIAELEAENGRLRSRYLPENLTDPLREVLGRMCFECITIARALRTDGMEIRHRAEDEQAEVIFFLLPFVLAYGSDWRKHAAEELGGMAERHRASLTREGGV
ncbi:hypothetical protein HKD28_14070 [Gluconobacter sp. LMG 1744]|uniref:hypothetical protein n=1 Tax=Gluconobacter TaxID=441 RepID=UPI001885828D|nr:hypothetical protein [Gluconobacter cadivus]MBF0892526.1 hypothetical protein [Gluconobacter cadivus]